MLIIVLYKAFCLWESPVPILQGSKWMQLKAKKSQYYEYTPFLNVNVEQECIPVPVLSLNGNSINLWNCDWSHPKTIW